MNFDAKPLTDANFSCISSCEGLTLYASPGHWFASGVYMSRNRLHSFFFFDSIENCVDYCVDYCFAIEMILTYLVVRQSSDPCMLSQLLMH